SLRRRGRQAIRRRDDRNPTFNLIASSHNSKWHDNTRCLSSRTPQTPDQKEIWMVDESIAFFESRYMPLREARMSIVDPAITKSDIVFDVVSATGGVFFRLDDHVERFETSCRKVRIVLPIGRDDLKRVCAECVHRSGFTDACVFMCGTRG